jgi:hypothetical protein
MLHTYEIEQICVRLVNKNEQIIYHGKLNPSYIFNIMIFDHYINASEGPLFE